MCVCVCLCMRACQLPCSLCRVKVVGGAQEKQAMEEEDPVKDAITVAAERSDEREWLSTDWREPVEA